MKPKRPFTDYLDDISDAIEKIERFTEGMKFKEFKSDDKTIFAVIRAMEVIGEAVKKIPKSVRDKHPLVPWHAQVESWDYVVQFGAQLRALPQEAIQRVVVVPTPWEALSQGSLSGIKHFIFTLTFQRLRHPPARIAHSFASVSIRSRFMSGSFSEDTDRAKSFLIGVRASLPDTATRR